MVYGPVHGRLAQAGGKVCIMKRLLVLLVVLAGACLAGCGLVDSQQERKRRYKTIVQLQSRMIVDDWDYFWLADKPSYLSPWQVRGNK